MSSFETLEVWQKGLLLVKKIYHITKSFPKDERFGLTSQIRRASVSIIANLAEGFSRYSKPDKAYKYTIARGECAEVHALLLICKELELIDENSADKLIKLNLQVGRMLTGLVKKYSS